MPFFFSDEIAEGRDITEEGGHCVEGTEIHEVNCVGGSEVYAWEILVQTSGDVGSED